MKYLTILATVFKHADKIKLLIDMLKQINKVTKDGKVTVREIWSVIETLLEGLGIEIEDREVMKF